MREISCDVLIAGGGTGGVAAALAATSLGCQVVLTEETEWIGGQLSSQAVPPDEHKWIEQFGCTASYRSYRNRVRDFYRAKTPLRPTVAANPAFNPGGGWVSSLCAEPRIAWTVLNEMLQPALASGRVDLRLQTIVAGGSHISGPPVQIHADVELHEDHIRAVKLLDLRSGEETMVHAKFFLDATELGDLLPLCKTEFVTGSEGRAAYGEPSGSETPQPDNQQAITWTFAMGHDAGRDHTIERPDDYDVWRSFQPPFWPGAFFGLGDLDPKTNGPRHPPLPLFSEDWRCWFKYRQVLDPQNFQAGYAAHPVTIVNWPQNDYFLGEVVNVDPATRYRRLQEAKRQSLCWLYWLQTECDSGLYLCPQLVGSEDGFALTPYIRESRRIVARRTVIETDISAAAHPGADRAAAMADSVGVGAYRIDLHPSTGSDAYVDLSTLPFQIPLGALIPVKTRNLLPACKNLGVTHVTNGCYRLHPIEWNIGEAAGCLAAFCVEHKAEPAQVLESQRRLEDLQRLLTKQGVEVSWPVLGPL